MDIQKTRNNFPLLHHHPRLVYLDSTATALKPQPVIDAVNQYYSKYSANVFRGIYKLSEQATQKLEQSRAAIANLIHAPSLKEIVFTRSTTESLNLLAYSWGRLHISPKDEIVTTIMEHHSNFVPWQQLAQENQALLKIIHLTPDYQLDLSHLDQIITQKTKALTLTHVSNVLGTINPVKKIISQAKQLNPHIITIVDGAQAVPHLPVDVQDLDCDFYCFSGHKMLGPTGIGILWGKKPLLEQLPPFQYGGEMIHQVTLNHTTFAPPPHKFEAGTPHIAGAIGLGAAVRYLQKLNIPNIRRHELNLIQYALKALQQIPNLKIYGPLDPQKRGAVISFTLKDIHAHDIAQVLDSQNIAIRSGHHCAMPLHQYLKIPATARASFYLYNTQKDIDHLTAGLQKVLSLFHPS